MYSNFEKAGKRKAYFKMHSIKEKPGGGKKEGSQ